MPERSAKKRPEAKKLLQTVLMALGGVAAAGFLIYMVYLVYSMSGHIYRTETAIRYTMADSVYLSGVAVFDAVEVEGGGNLGYLVEDGERVTSGTVLAERYTDAAQGAQREELTNLAGAISLLEKSQNSAGSDLSVLTSQTASALYDLLDQLDTADYSATEPVEQQFLLAQNRLQISTGQVSDFSATLASLQAQYDTLAAGLAGLETVTASTNGYFISAAKAGYLSVDAQTIAGASPAEFRTLLNSGLQTDAGGTAGRIVTGFSWTFYVVGTAEDAARFTEGARVKLSVPGKLDTPLSATVEAVEIDEEADAAKITLACESISAGVLTLSQEQAKIDLHTYEGIRIDKAALHIWQGDRGVYVKYGNIQRFRKITILYENEDYILVPDDGALGTDNEVRLYDEIIVEGKNLQDGKLL